MSSHVLIIDGSAFSKQGSKSVGVARQYCARLSKVANWQAGVFLTYASERGHALVDTKLCLAREWTRNAKRCQMAGVRRRSESAWRCHVRRRA